MIGNAHIQPEDVEHLCRGQKETLDPALDWQQLAQEVGCLRRIVAELLVKNQNLRWALLAQDPLPSRTQAFEGLRGKAVV